MDELRAAILRVQLGRLEGMPGVEIAPNHSPDGHCGMCLYLRVENRAAALAFKHDACARGVSACLPFDSGRHVYANWEPIMQRRGAYHPVVDPLHITEAGRAQQYAPDMLPRTLEHLERTVSVAISPA